jgi:spermidine synthase
VSSVLSYLVPQKLAEFSTKYNRHIRVNDEYGKRKLLVNGSVQSGRYIQSLWKKAFHAFGISKNTQWNTILVLGVGGGTVIELLHGQFPKACITGVDIDTVIIDIAKKYFLTGDIAYINFTVADAMKFVRQHTSTYDCIIIDIFVGNEVPEFVKTTSFITLCKQRLSPNGAVCINYLQDRQYREKSDEFNQVLRSTFSKVCDFRIANNRFFFASIV